jgi:two-component system response regulator HydG
MKPEILVVDDDASHRKMLQAVLSAEGYAVTQASDGQQAVDAVKEKFYELILMDIRMNRMGGIEALKRIKEISPGIPIVIMTGYASVNTAVEALKSGAYDYITKPLDIDDLKVHVKNALSHFQLEQENLFLKERVAEQYDFSKIIGRCEPMMKMYETLSLVAPSDATVLILGESGTGKELVANAIHQNSPRKNNPFIKVNCAALPETLLESELFGHERGAFSGAATQKKGRFANAHTGTIFLDEIAEMPPTTQVKILRVLQEQEFEPLGSSKSVKVDIRIITATNQVLEDEIENGNFREDLYYRLNVVSVKIPLLRERKDDILLLADYFLKKYSDKNKKMIKGFSPRTIDLLMRHPWPGNVRELENAVERSVILAREEVLSPEYLPDAIKELDKEASDDSHDFSSGQSLKSVEKQMILRTLEDTNGNRTHAAEILGISRRTLQLKLKKYNIK